jgi:hypothetical protein
MQLSTNKSSVFRPLAVILQTGLVALALAGCDYLNTPTPTAVPVDTPTVTPTHIDKPKPPTATAAVFELRDTSTPFPSPTPFVLGTPPGSGYGPYGFPNNIDPLTGQPVDDPTLLARRPLVIKITNFPRTVRPQWGLTVADNVYEYYLEDGMTRFIGVFYGKDAQRVGPVRSGRPFDEYIIRMYKGIFAFAYADDRLIDFWEGSDINPYIVFETPKNCPPMCRIGSSDSYNNLFTNTHDLTQYGYTTMNITQGRQNLNGLRFEEDTLILSGGGLATRLETHFSLTSYNYWEYDPATLRYYRWQEAERGDQAQLYEPLFDSLTAQQVYADNLVVLLAPTKYFYKSNSTEVYDFELIGRGKGYALRQGKIFDIYWQRPNQDSLISLVFPNGNYYPLKPGNTFFEVLGDQSTHQVLDKTWLFNFVIPENMPSPTPTPKSKKTSP